MTRRITAPELDDLLGKLTSELLEELRTRIPPGYADQVEAARHEGVQLMKFKDDDTVGWIPPTDVDEWIRLAALDTLILWVDGRTRTCMHSRTTADPNLSFRAPGGQDSSSAPAASTSLRAQRGFAAD